MYLDNAATTPLSEEVELAIVRNLDCFGNPSSLYSIGVETKELMDIARVNSACLIGADPDEIYFTPSGSASNTAIIRGWHLRHNQDTILYSSIGHKSLIKCCEACNGISVPVDNAGRLDLENLERKLIQYAYTDILVVISAADSEIGTIQDIRVIDELCSKYNALLYMDVTGYIPTNRISVNKFKSVCMLGFSAHKLGALKGCGILYIPSYINIQETIEPLVYGSQEKGLIGGTENVIGIVSAGKACELYDYSRISNITSLLTWNLIQKNIDNVNLIGCPIGENRLSNNLFVQIGDVRGEQVMMMLDMEGIQISTGSACNSSDGNISATLAAIGLSDEQANECIRITFSGKETIQDINYFVERLRYVVSCLREIS